MSVYAVATSETSERYVKLSLGREEFLASKRSWWQVLADADFAIQAVAILVFIVLGIYFVMRSG